MEENASMLSKLLTLAHGKALAALAGAALLAGGGTAAALAATHTHVGLGSLLVAAAPAGPHARSTPDAGNHGDQRDVAIEGVLKSYSASTSGGTITVLAEGETTATTITVNAQIRINGEHATSLTDLTAAVGHKVQVQATKQSDGTLLAWKVTVQGADPGAHGKGHLGHGDGHGGDSHGAGGHGGGAATPSDGD
jgi:hypothetical protein